MKRILFIIRDGYDAKYICTEIEKWRGDYEIVYIIESGKIARKKKINRMLKKEKLFSAFINMVFLFLYDRDMMRRMKAICKERSYPKNGIYFYVDDVNEKKCIDIVKKHSPDLLLVYGSGIIKEKTIDALQTDIYNIHSSILPYYRNVHSDFWAFLNKDYKKIGITIFKLNTGVDTGSIAMQMVCDLPEGSRLEEYKVQNIKNIVCLLQRFLDEYFKRNIDLSEQDDSKATVSQTPRAKDIFRFWRQS